MSTTAADDATGRVRDLVDEIATVVAGDDPAAYAGTVVALLNVAGELVDAPGEQRGRLAMHQLSRQRQRGRQAVAVPQPPGGESIWTDAQFLANFNPLRHCVELVRHAAFGWEGWSDVLRLGALVVFGLVLWRVAIHAMTRKLID